MSHTKPIRSNYPCHPVRKLSQEHPRRAAALRAKADEWLEQAVRERRHRIGGGNAWELCDAADAAMGLARDIDPA